MLKSSVAELLQWGLQTSAHLQTISNLWGNSLFQNGITRTLAFIDGLPWWLSGKESFYDTEDAGDPDSIPGLGRSPGGGHGNAFQYSCLENPHGQSSLVGYSPWGRKDSYMTEKLSTAHNIKPMCQSRFRNMYLIVNWQVYLTLTWHSPYQEVILKVWISNAITRCWCKNLFSLKVPRIYGDNWTTTVLLLDINKSHLLSSKQIMEPI